MNNTTVTTMFPNREEHTWVLDKGAERIYGIRKGGNRPVLFYTEGVPPCDALLRSIKWALHPLHGVIYVNGELVYKVGDVVMLKAEDVIEVRKGKGGYVSNSGYVDIRTHEGWYGTTMSFLRAVYDPSIPRNLDEITLVPPEDLKGLLEEGTYEVYDSIEHLMVVETML